MIVSPLDSCDSKVSRKKKVAKNLFGIIKGVRISNCNRNLSVHFSQSKYQKVWYSLSFSRILISKAKSYELLHLVFFPPLNILDFYTIVNWQPWKARVWQEIPKVNCEIKSLENHSKETLWREDSQSPGKWIFEELFLNQIFIKKFRNKLLKTNLCLFHWIKMLKINIFWDIQKSLKSRFMIKRFKLDEKLFERSCKSFSGGWKVFSHYLKICDIDLEGPWSWSIKRFVKFEESLKTLLLFVFFGICFSENRFFNLASRKHNTCLGLNWKKLFENLFHSVRIKNISHSK